MSMPGESAAQITQKKELKHQSTRAPRYFSQLFSEARLDFKTKKLIPGEHLCYQGHASLNLYFLQSGLLKSYVNKIDGQEFIMGFTLPSDLFGWEGFDKPRHAISVVALVESIIYIIKTEQLFEFTQKNPQLGNQLLCMISRRIHHDNIALLRTSAKQRVATFLLQLTARYRELGYPNDRCQLQMAHQDIANYLRINASTISRIFNDLEKKKLIRIDKQTVYLNDISELRLLAEMDP